MDYTKTLDLLKAHFPQGLLHQSLYHSELRITFDSRFFTEMMQFLYDEPSLGYTFLTDIVGIDYPKRNPRFELTYILFNMNEARRLYVKLPVAEGQYIPSVTGIWKAANWMEREVFDLFGIPFINHPDLRRILTWDSFEGHALRKDYPLQGRDFEKRFDPDTIVIE